MITNNGREIISKYLVEQAPSYASYIAVGCGINPNADTAYLNFTTKNTLDFEMFRVPIVSRNYTTDGTISKITFSAELPSQEIYYITEAGIFSSGSNPVASSSDSRTLYSFSSNENWEYHAEETAIGIQKYTIATLAPSGGIIDSANLTTPFYVDTTDPLFSNASRSKYLEQPRFLDNSIVLPGAMSTITGTNPVTEVWTATGEPHIHLANQILPFDINSSLDKFKIAFSVLKTDPVDPAPTNVYLMIEFSSSEIEDETGEYARAQIKLTSADFGTPNNNYYYFVKDIELSELKKSPSFNWGAVTVAKIFLEVDGDNDYYVILDGFRFENIFDMNANPIYGLTSYSPFYTIDYKPKLKDSNTSNLIEIEFDLEHEPEVISW